MVVVCNDNVKLEFVQTLVAVDNVFPGDGIAEQTAGTKTTTLSTPISSLPKSEVAVKRKIAVALVELVNDAIVKLVHDAATP